ncbi:MAG: hypothetical protein NT128_04075, partial [Proteobacteria bacterium]|nr:hypothetical protein [Pseudomonadota bacterium]
MLSRRLFNFSWIFYCFFTVSFVTPITASVEVKTVFGSLKLEKELFKIYNMKHMQRLKGVDQSGTPAYWDNIPKFSRLEHSVDVLWLVQHFGGDIKEQIAALVHDISHTAFSHVADIFFGVPGYQDTIHEWFLQQTEIDSLICGLDLTGKDILPENPEFKRLEQPLPDMCADRIAYNIHTALMLKMINSMDITKIINSLRFDDNLKRWYFTDRKVAKKFAMIPLKLMKVLWCSSDDAVIYHITSLILKRAFRLQRVTKEDMNFCTDQEILDKLAACDDPTIKRLVSKAKFVKKFYRILKKGEGTPDF